jgi:hypothetical protein
METILKHFSPILKDEVVARIEERIATWTLLPEGS